MFATEHKPLYLSDAPPLCYCHFRPKGFAAIITLCGSNYDLDSHFQIVDSVSSDFGGREKGFVLRIVTLTCRELADLPFEVLISI